jgi:hypothetical protein
MRLRCVAGAPTSDETVISLKKACAMDKGIVDRRRLLNWLALGSLAVPAMTLAACASGGGTRPPNFRTGGGNRGGEKSGGNGGSLGGKRS